MSSQAVEKRKETLASMCDEKTRMLQDQFNVSMNHVQAMSIAISTFHHGKRPSAIDQGCCNSKSQRKTCQRHHSTVMQRSLNFRLRIGVDFAAVFYAELDKDALLNP
ncbi:hypothetical protein ACSBR1_013627 [Camellia fascicularis]